MESNLRGQRRQAAVVNGGGRWWSAREKEKGKREREKREKEEAAHWFKLAPVATDWLARLMPMWPPHRQLSMRQPLCSCVHTQSHCNLSIAAPLRVGCRRTMSPLLRPSASPSYFLSRWFVFKQSHRTLRIIRAATVSTDASLSWCNFGHPLVQLPLPWSSP
jgi:hypothetical protein